ncbi:MAG: hypothetical protein LBF85_08360 [Tannerella sp.]|jgi:hypothetical protein|nr:hypothetical protein [Tannerella sp.]
MTELPPYIYILDGLGAADTLQGASTKISRHATATTNSVVILKQLDVLTPRESAVTVSNRTAIRSGSISGNAEDVLRYIFWSSHRAKMRNRKHATAWRTYNQY